MFDQIFQQKSSNPEPANPNLKLLLSLCAICIKVSARRITALAPVFLLITVSAHAQSNTTPEVSPSSPTLYTSPTPDEESNALPIPSATTAPPEYRVGTGDVLGITIYNMPELNRNEVVGSKGTLRLSYFPQPLDVDAQTVGEIGQKVASQLKVLQVLIDPQVSVAVLRVQSKPVVVGGSVRNPQVLQEVRPLTLQETLMLAGGPEIGAGNSVVVTRKDGTGSAISYDLSLPKVLSGTDSQFNIEVNPGDTVQVLPGQKVFVAGDVKTPGAFPVGHGHPLTVSKLMALTGGWTADAKPSKAVIVREGSNGQRQTLPLDLPKIMARKQPDVTVEANDLVYVPDSTEKKVGLGVIKGVGSAVMVATGYLIIR